jgi:hypothetical protein
MERPDPIQRSIANCRETGLADHAPRNVRLRPISADGRLTNAIQHCKAADQGAAVHMLLKTHPEIISISVSDAGAAHGYADRRYASPPN